MKSYLTVVIILLIPTVQGQAAGPVSAGQRQDCILLDSVNPVGGAVLGQIRYCIVVPESVATSTSNIPVSLTLTTPVYFPGLATIGTTFTFLSLQGCATSGAATTLSNAGAGAAIGFQISVAQRLLLSSGECSGWIEAKLATVTPAVTYFDGIIAFSFFARDSIQNVNSYDCNSTGAASNAFTTAQVCNQSTDNIVNSGTITQTGTIGVVNSGTITQTGTINNVNSGVITQTGTIGITGVTIDTGDVTVSIPDTLTINKAPGFGDSVFLLILLIIFGLIIAGEMSHDNIYKLIAGALCILDSVIVVRTREAIGVDLATSRTLATILAILALYLSFHLLIAKQARSP